MVPRSDDGDDRQRVLAAGGREAGAVDRVDGDVAGRSATVADVLAVEEHGRLVLLALADHDEAVEVDCGEEGAHRVDGGLVGAVLVAAADPRHGADRRSLRGPHEFEGEVAIGVLIEAGGFRGAHLGPPGRIRRLMARHRTAVDRSATAISSLAIGVDVHRANLLTVTERSSDVYVLRAFSARRTTEPSKCRRTRMPSAQRHRGSVDARASTCARRQQPRPARVGRPPPGRSP